jgi:predicted nucleic acid-binding protein
MVAAAFLDTNILFYAFTDDERAQRAQALLTEPFMVSVQTLNEFSNAVRKKLNLPWASIEDAIESIVAVCSGIVAIDEKTTLAALKLAQRYNFAFCDALMVTAALGAGCKRYYSEDLQNGLVIDRQLTVINPFQVR